MFLHYKPRLTLAIMAGLALVASANVARAGEDTEALPLVTGVEPQPLKAQVARVAQALELTGAPLTPEQRKSLDAAIEEQDATKSVAQIQAVLDPLCLAGVSINPESRVKVAAGVVPKTLMQHGWRVFLVKIHNEAGVTARLRVASPNAAKLHKPSTSSPNPVVSISPQEASERFLDIELVESQPLNAKLSGLPLEYRIIELYSRDAGQREAKLMFDVGQGTQDLGFRNELNVLFQCEPAVRVALDVIDDDGQPTTGQFVFRDAHGRVYPARSRRMAPDLFFHDQIYRHSGEVVLLPPGKFEVTYTRGPEYRIQKRAIDVPNSATHRESFRLKRWIDMAKLGWISGDHHVHSAGCAHYESPAEGIQPEDMMRHILGEDLDVGCVLSWGPCWYFQKQFFEGKVSALSTPRNLMRYDVEVSGFPSSHCGHLCLLRLKEDDYPGTTKIDEWPSWDLPVLKWGKEQGGVVGFSHSGWGMQVKDQKLPSFEMPPFDGIGANEYVVDVVHDVCDFISAVDTPIVYELSIWYHTLNCGYTCRISGETDFPCIYGERVGLGRSYVQLDEAAKKPLDYDQWVSALRDGRSYASEGLTHLFNFTAGGLGVGQKGAGGRASFITAKAGDAVPVRVSAAALLDEEPREEIRKKPLSDKPYWHVERARVGDTRKVPVQLIVNGKVVETQAIEADGAVNDLVFSFKPERSSWVAVRVFAAAHTNPIFVEVDGQPIRASRRSAQWCLDGVDVCWKQKVGRIRPAEQEAAAVAYETARNAYRKILAETTVD
ncbi:MAG TPA: CehA/McbA family metallohydrolase [Pirellulales bacterium]